MTHEEYLKLTAVIDHHMKLYYDEDAPEISDVEYDALMRQLKEAERQNPEWVTPDSPTQKIGGTAKREAGVKVTHRVPMLSIEDVFTKEEVRAFVERVKEKHPDAEFSVETKIDGLSMTLRYVREPGGELKLTLAETRGDGRIGEDVTLNALTIPDVLRTLPLPYEMLELRGEVYMSHEAFDRFNALQEEAGPGFIVQGKGNIQGIGALAVHLDLIHVILVGADEQGGIGKDIFLLHGLGHGLHGVGIQRPAGNAVANDLESQAFQDVGVFLYGNVSVCDGRELAPLLGKAISIMEGYTVPLYAVQQRDTALSPGCEGQKCKKEYADYALHDCCRKCCRISSNWAMSCTRTSRGLAPFCGPTMPAASSWSITRPAFA